MLERHGSADGIGDEQVGCVPDALGAELEPFYMGSQNTLTSRKWNLQGLH